MDKEKKKKIVAIVVTAVISLILSIVACILPPELAALLGIDAGTDESMNSISSPSCQIVGADTVAQSEITPVTPSLCQFE